MNVYELENLPSLLIPTVVTIGVFDGVHKGHQQIINTVIKRAKEIKALSVVVTFDPHPSEILKPGHHPSLLTSTPLKLELIKELGVDIVLIIKFTKVFSRLEPEEFLKKILVEKLKVKSVIVGEGFRFGRDGRGDINLLKKFGQQEGFEVIQIPLVSCPNGQRISSTRIRQLLREGNLSGVAEILGRFPHLSGQVVKGKGRGVKIGIHTANIKTSDKASIPKNGVYAGIIKIDNQKKICVINIGPSPTFEDKEHRVEAHILDFNKNIYNHWVELEIIERIRDVISFSTTKELAQQIKKDIAKTKEFFRKFPL